MVAPAPTNVRNCSCLFLTAEAFVALVHLRFGVAVRSNKWEPRRHRFQGAVGRKIEIQGRGSPTITEGVFNKSTVH